MSRLTWKIGAVMALAAGLIGTSASAAETPETLAGAKRVSAAEVKALKEKGVKVIDTRVAEEYAEAHIPGSISVPYKEKSEKAVGFDPSKDSFDLSKLPADKSQTVVMYCNAGSCWKSYKASAVAIKAGYKDIRWFRGGLPEWKEAGFPTE